MRVSSLLLLLAATAGCLAKQPPFEVVGKSMFIAVELDPVEHEFWVTPVDLRDGEDQFPAILIEDEQRIAVYFYDGPLDALGSVPNVPAIRTGPPPDAHPKPIKSLLSVVEDGAFGQWVEGGPLLTDLGLRYCCPTPRQDWVLSSDGFKVDLETLWVLAEPDSWLMGSKLGFLYRIQRTGQLDLLSSSVRAREITKVGEDFYGIFEDASGNAVTRGGRSPTALTSTIVSGTSLTRSTRFRGRTAQTGTELALAVFDGVRTASPSPVRTVSWSESKAFCAIKPGCEEDPTAHVLLVDSPNHGFVGALSSHACVGFADQLPAFSSISVEQCPIIESLTSRGEAGLVVATAGGEVFVLDDNEWSRTADGLDQAPIVAAKDYIAGTSDGRFVQIFDVGKKCVHTDFPSAPGEVKALLADDEGALIVSASATSVQVERLVEVSHLDLCSDNEP